LQLERLNNQPALPMRLRAIPAHTTTARSETEVAELDGAAIEDHETTITKRTNSPGFHNLRPQPTTHLAQRFDSCRHDAHYLQSVKPRRPSGCRKVEAGQCHSRHCGYAHYKDGQANPEDRKRETLPRWTYCDSFWCDRFLGTLHRQQACQPRMHRRRAFP
jgi:hypothetical protein